jgi:transcriptional regulator of acetoin/glycerol metabolism
MDHNWPGNIRELQNVIEHAFILCKTGLINPSHLPKDIVKLIKPNIIQPGGGTLKEIEKQAILDTLIKNKWKKLATAKALGINKTTLWRKIKKFDIHVPEKE